MMKNGEAPLEFLDILGEATSRDYWDWHFSLNGAGDTDEWYVKWPFLRHIFLSQLSSVPSVSTYSDSSGAPPQILIPGCGSSSVSEHLYDAGFQQITNIDFSKFVVSDMLRRNVRSRPEMRWRVMDMTDLQFADESFDVVIDKAGLDALMDEDCSESGSKPYIKEVTRVLKSGGKFLCVTLAESHVLDLVFNRFRFGWKTTIHLLPSKDGKRHSYPIFMIVFLKDKLATVSPIGTSFGDSILDCNTEQTQLLVDTIKIENQIREEHCSCANLEYSLRDLRLGAHGKRNGSFISSDGFNESMEIDRSSLASVYHTGIIPGYSPVAYALQNSVSLRERVRVILVGLGAGLFPTCLHICLPFSDIEVVELDPVVLELAKDYFDFKENARLKVHIGDGIKLIQNENIQHPSEYGAIYKEDSSTNSEFKCSILNGKNDAVMKIIIIDADSSDLSCGLACPPAEFVEEAFLSSVKDFLSVGGLFVTNLASRSSAIREMVITKLKMAFNHLFSLELEEDVNEVLFASSDPYLQEDDLTNAVDRLQTLLKVPLPDIETQAKNIKRL